MKMVKIPRREEGQGLVEYALILVLVAIVVIVILTQFGSLIVLTFATIIGSFTGQQLTNVGTEGIIVSSSDGEDIGGGNCRLNASDLSVVLVENGEIVTDSTETVTFGFGSGITSSGVVTIGGSGVGMVNLGVLNNTCPAKLEIVSW